ncbi:MAG: hypothetical protein AMXMBFR58_22260 [Phycisphaerae bacterium]
MTTEKHDAGRSAPLPGGDDYAWSAAPPGDADVRRIEEMLAPRRFDASAARTLRNRNFQRSRLTRTPVLALAACVALVSGGIILYQFVPPTAGPHPGGLAESAWSVEPLSGTVTMNGRALLEEDPLGAGQWIETGSQARASLSGKSVGRVTLEPNSRLRLVNSREAEHRLELASGRLHAFITAPPRLFVVDTPAATAVDMGCVYDLSVLDDGSTLLEVFSGWVELGGPARASRVPAGYRCLAPRGHDPSVPVRTEAPPEFVEAVGVLAAAPSAASGPAQDSLKAVLETASVADAATLWNLLQRLDGQPRREIALKLARLVPPPGAVNVEGAAAGDPAMLEAWWTQVRWSL